MYILRLSSYVFLEYRYKSYIHRLQYGPTNYSGRKLTKFGRCIDLNFFMSFDVTLQDSNVRDLKFFSVFKCCSPAVVMRDFERFKEINPVSPDIVTINMWAQTYLANLLITMSFATLLKAKMQTVHFLLWKVLINCFKKKYFEETTL